MDYSDIHVSGLREALWCNNVMFPGATSRTKRVLGVGDVLLDNLKLTQKGIFLS